MNTEEISREQISALADGELGDRQLAAILADLRDKDARETWDIYHQIGDVLRSDDMAIGLSAGFAERMAARLEAEPTIVAPAVLANPAATASLADEDNNHRAKRWAVPGIAAAAAMAAIAFVTTPQLMVALKGSGSPVASQPIVAVNENPGTGKIVPAASGLGENARRASSVPDGVVLRDPRIDDYLLAHQRFSSSVYSTAQYARAVTLATDSDK